MAKGFLFSFFFFFFFTPAIKSRIHCLDVLSICGALASKSFFTVANGNSTLLEICCCVKEEEEQEEVEVEEVDAIDVGGVEAVVELLLLLLVDVMTLDHSPVSTLCVRSKCSKRTICAC